MAPQRARPDDAAQELVAYRRVVAREVGLVVVGRGRQVGVSLGQVELPAVLLQGVVLEDAVGHVTVALLGNLAGPALAQADQLLELAEAAL